MSLRRIVLRLLDVTALIILILTVETPGDRALRQAIYRGQPERDAEAALARGDLRFLAAGYDGGWIAPAGISLSSYCSECQPERLRTIAGTGFLASEPYWELAYSYAQRYNTDIVEHFRRRAISPPARDDPAFLAAFAITAHPSAATAGW